jgi:predicted dienelactone hydrolase
MAGKPMIPARARGLTLASRSRHRPPMRLLPLLVVAACTATADDDSASVPAPCPPLAPPAPDLDALAGTREWSTSWTVPWTGQERPITVHTWYPTDATEGEPVRWLDAFPDEHSLVNAPLRAGDCRLPVVVWSHGSQAWAGNGSDVMRQLARQGYLVVAPDHTGNTLTDNQDPKPASFPLLRAGDVVAALDALEDLPTSDPLAARLDTSSVLVTGHSYGGQTSWLFSGPTFDPIAIDQRCQDASPPCDAEERAAFDALPGDPRVVAVAPLAGDVGVDLAADSGWSTMHGPVLYMTGTLDFDGGPMFQRASEGAVTWAEVDGACHESFTSTALGCDGLPKDEGLTLVARWIQAFAAWTLLGSDEPDVVGVLDGSSPVSDRVTVHRTDSAGP